MDAKEISIDELAKRAEEEALREQEMKMKRREKLTVKNISVGEG